MIPPVVHPDTKSYGEEEIFRALASDESISDWIVLHSLDTANHVQRIFGEVDFLVLIPGRGVLSLEVKASKRIRRERGVWYYGSSAPDYRGPFKQAAQAMHSVRNHVTRELPDMSNVIFWSAVCFPYTEFSESSSEWHSWQVLDQRQVRAHSYPYLLEQVMKNAWRFLEEKRASWLLPPGTRPTIENCQRIAACLRPNFEVLESPKSRRYRIKEELKLYTQEQMTALDSMEENPRVLFTGPAGTGKTLLAIEGARRASARNKTTLLLCFNRSLSQMLQEQVQALPDVNAQTLHAFMLNIAGIPTQNNSHFWEEQLPEQAFYALVEKEPYYDMLIVDETQDILRESYLAVLDACLKGGLENGNWQFYGDFERQQIYGKSTEQRLDSFRETYAPATYSLRVNCRNTPHIAQSARYYGRLNPPYRKILRPDNGIQVSTKHYKDSEHQARLLSASLEELYQEGFAGEDIVILSPVVSSACATRLAKAPWVSRLAPYRYGLRGEIGYTTIFAFKGLEAPAIIITDIEDIENENMSQLFYVAVTRAVDRLVILAKDSTRLQFQNILSKYLMGEHI